MLPLLSSRPPFSHTQPAPGTSLPFWRSLDPTLHHKIILSVSDVTPQIHVDHVIFQVDHVISSQVIWLCKLLFPTVLSDDTGTELVV